MIRLVLLLGLAMPFLANAQPTGARPVASGGATFPAPASPLTISPTTNSSIINWQQFSIGTDATKLSQPAAAAPVLNRAIGGNAIPQVQGIMLTNPAGLPAQAGSAVQVQSAIVRPNSANEAVRMPDGKIVFRATPQ